MENWKPIPGYDGLYEASTDGRIRTAKGKTTSNARFPSRVWKQRVLVQKASGRKSGRHKDFRVSLWKDGTVKTHLVARLIALTWCDGYKDGYTVNHIDGNPENNVPSNLEWISLKGNILHGFEMDLYPQKHCTLSSEDGRIYSFRSLAQASLFLNRSKGYVHQCIKRGKAVSSTDGTFYSVAC